MLGATILSDEVTVAFSDQIVRGYCIVRDTYQKEVIDPFHNWTNAFGAEEVSEGISKVSKEASGCGATKGVAGVEGKQVRLVGDTYHHPRPLVLVERDDPVSLCNVTNGSLGSRGKAEDEGRDRVEGAPGAWEIF